MHNMVFIVWKVTKGVIRSSKQKNGQYNDQQRRKKKNDTKNTKIEPTKNQGRTHVFRMDQPFLLH
jgi:hypothetical protein